MTTHTVCTPWRRRPEQRRSQTWRRKKCTNDGEHSGEDRQSRLIHGTSWSICELELCDERCSRRLSSVSLEDRALPETQQQRAALALALEATNVASANDFKKRLTAVKLFQQAASSWLYSSFPLSDGRLRSFARLWCFHDSS